MSDGITDGIWVVRVWREDGDPATVRGRITTMTGGPAATETSANERTVATTSIEQIENDLHDFLLTIISGRQQHGRTG